MTWNLDELARISIPVQIDGEDYTLYEADGEVAPQYHKRILTATKPGGKLSDLPDATYYLVANCMHKDGKPVTEKTVRSWGNRRIQALYHRIREVSGLIEQTKERNQLKAALEREDAPIALEEFRVWVASLGDEYAELRAWLAPNYKELAGNLPAKETTGFD